MKSDSIIMTQKKTAGKAFESQNYILMDSDFHFISQFVHDRVGIVLNAEKRTMVHTRLVRRLRALNLKTFKEYCDLLASDTKDHELPYLINAITTNLTRFFREQHHFDHLQNDVLVPFVRQMNASMSGHKHLRIWSAGCSTGEEPYSIAMTLCEAIPNIAQYDARILATDVDTNVIAHGKLGRYKEKNEITHDLVKKYCHVYDDQSIEMNESLKNLVHFKPLNLISDWPIQGKFHAIFCRNVVIYFDKKTQMILFDRMADAMVDGGWLYIGHSETLHQICDDRFRLIGRTIYQKVK